jgi:hypothetical protein
MYFSCVLEEGHEGSHRGGGNCFTHGEYIGTYGCHTCFGGLNGAETEQILLEGRIGVAVRTGHLETHKISEQSQTDSAGNRVGARVGVGGAGVPEPEWTVWETLEEGGFGRRIHALVIVVKDIFRS